MHCLLSCSGSLIPTANYVDWIGEVLREYTSLTIWVICARMNDGKSLAFEGQVRVFFAGFSRLSTSDGVRVGCATIDDQEVLKEPVDVQFHTYKGVKQAPGLPAMTDP